MTTSRNVAGSSKCIRNPKCCYDTHDLECPNKFSPPLLSSPTEFCTEALAKGIPIPRCVLAKPKKLQIDLEPPPLAKPVTSRHLKNWQRWCYIWRQTYNKLTAGRDTEVRPPVMSSGEVHRIKKEDKELFDRTLHTYHLTGYYVKNTQAPDSIRPKPCGSNADIKEVVTKRHVRDFPEMKRRRYPNYVRNEISLPPRKSSTKVKSIVKQAQMRSPTGFNWEEQWAKTKHVDKMKEQLACDIDMYGKTEPSPDNLIFKQLNPKDGPSERIFDKRKEKGRRSGNLTVPQLVFSTDVEAEDKGQETRMSTASDRRSSSYYSEQRGPVLRIRSQFSELLMTFLGTSGSDFAHFISNPTKSLGSPDGDGSAFFYDDDHHFSITTKCKETKFILLKNEGTTAIRYQWFRSPPTFDTEQMLQDPTNFRHIRLGPNDESQQENEDFGSNSSNVGDQSTSQSDGVPLNRVTKPMHLEFHFCSLPGIILPGQSLEFPIIFRSKRPGFFNETLYLLTHPRLVSSETGKSYSVRLSGVCADVEIAEKSNEGLKRFLSKKSMEEETMDLMDSILDRALWEATNITTSDSSLPNGRVTAESIFYAHNSDYYYHFGKSEKAIELIRQLIEMLVPKERVETRAECDLSLQSMYNLVLSAREQDDLHWTQLRSSQCEDLLERLDTECMYTLREQRTFAWPNTQRRKYTACYTNLVVTFDEILLGFDRLRNLYNAPAIKLIDQRKAEQLVEDYLLKEQEKQQRMEMDGSGEQAVIIFGETEVDNIPPVTEPQLNNNTIATMAMDEEEEEEEIPYWLAAFEEMMSPYNLDAQQAFSVSKEKAQRQQQSGKEQSGGQDQQDEYELSTTESPAPPLSGGGAGDAPVSTSWSSPVKQGEKKRESTVLTLQETMQLQAKQTRRQMLTEARVKLFEELFCVGIQRMLATVDNFNNMLDYRDTDAIVVIDDKC